MSQMLRVRRRKDGKARGLKVRGFRVGKIVFKYKRRYRRRIYRGRIR